MTIASPADLGNSKVAVSFTSDLHRGFSNKTDRLQRKYFDQFFSENKPDVLVLAGDIASHGKPDKQWNGMFRVLRDRFSGPILAVRGNHDFWFFDYNESLEKQNQLWSKACADWGVVNLEGKAVEIYGQVFAGWLSWWQGRAPDQARMSTQVRLKEMHDLERDTYSSMLSQLALLRGAARNEVSTVQGGAPTFVTHMAPGDSPWTSAASFHPAPGVLISGHTHVNRDEMLRGVRILNSGPDYDCPNAQTILADKDLEVDFWQLRGEIGRIKHRYE